MNSYQKPSKLAIAQSFSNAAASYDQAAELQRSIGQQLIQQLPSQLMPSTLVDLGCGTGYFTKQLQQRFRQADVFGIDLAEGMLKQSKALNEACYWLAGDAEQLPLVDNSVDLIFSNLAVQWCHDFSKVLEEAHRVLKPQGVFVFTSLCEGTLAELVQSWRTVDDYIHVNNFLGFADYQALLTASPFDLVHSEPHQQQAFYDDLKALMADLKGIGAHNINPQRKQGLTARSELKKLVTAYEVFRTEQGLPTTYQVIYGRLEKRK